MKITNLIIINSHITVSSAAIAFATDASHDCEDLSPSCSQSWSSCSDTHWKGQCPGKCGTCCEDILSATCESAWFDCSYYYYQVNCRKSCGLQPQSCSTGGTPPLLPPALTNIPTASPTLSPTPRLTASPTKKNLRTSSPTMSPAGNDDENACDGLEDQDDQCSAPWFVSKPEDWCSGSWWWRDTACRLTCCLAGLYPDDVTPPPPDNIIPPPAPVDDPTLTPPDNIIPLPAPVDGDFVPLVDPDANKPVVVGYYPNWSYWRSGQRKYSLDMIPSGVTHVNYAFMDVKNGECAHYDVLADNAQFKLQRDPKVKYLVSLGGWTLSGGFSAAASTPESRKHLVSSCIRTIITDNNFDGIDLDWEYPAREGKGNPHNASDKRNFSLLVREFKMQLDALAVEKGKYFLLTAAVSAEPYLVR